MSVCAVSALIGLAACKAFGGSIAPRIRNGDKPAVNRTLVNTPSSEVSEPVDRSLLPSDARLWQPSRGLRALVFAPHPDDETLAAGGLIQKLQQRGGRARVVFLTDGDGYVDGVRAWWGKTQPGPEDFIDYGRVRRGEAGDAVRKLGLAAQPLFLGFPDDGLAQLWRHWDRAAPWRSPHTGKMASGAAGPNQTRFRYAGEDLVAELRSLLELWHPDLVVLPDPRDEHPDHCNASLFVLAAWQQAESKGVHIPELLTYLVHFPGYPGSQEWPVAAASAGICGQEQQRLAGVDHTWVYVPLSSPEMARKRAALSAYRTQLQVMRGFLEQMIRPVEVFASWNPETARQLWRQLGTRSEHASLASPRSCGKHQLDRCPAEPAAAGGSCGRKPVRSIRSRRSLRVIRAAADRAPTVFWRETACS